MSPPPTAAPEPSTDNRGKERLWLSPHCLEVEPPKPSRQLSMGLDSGREGA